MTDLTQLGYELFTKWSKAIEQFNNRLGGQYGPGINTGSATRLSPTEGKLQYTSVDAQLHHQGRVLAEARILVDYPTQTLQVTHPNHLVQTINPDEADLSELVNQVVSELTAGVSTR